MKRSAVAALAAAGLVAWGLLDRRDRRAIAADPAWDELRATVPHEEQEVRSTDGTRIHVEIYGPKDAPVIVLLHGWTQAIRFWNYQIRDLTDRFRVVAYDQRGHGRSGVPGELGQHAEALGDDLEAVLRAFVPEPQRAVIAGHSMGGISIAAWAARYPESVARRAAAVAMVNTGVREVEEHVAMLGRRAGGKVNTRLLRPLLIAPLPLRRRIDPLAFRVARYVALGRGASPGLVAFVHENVVATTPRARAGVIRAFRGLDLSQALANLTVPVAVISGGDDRLFPAWHARFMASQLPNIVDYVEIRGSGHVSPLEMPAEVNRRLRRLATVYLASYAGSGPNEGGSGDASSGTEYTEAADSVEDSIEDSVDEAVADDGRASTAADPIVTVPLTVPPSSTRRRDARMSPTSVPEPPTVNRA